MGASFIWSGSGTQSSGAGGQSLKIEANGLRTVTVRSSSSEYTRTNASGHSHSRATLRVPIFSHAPVAICAAVSSSASSGAAAAGAGTAVAVCDAGAAVKAARAAAAAERARYAKTFPADPDASEMASITQSAVLWNVVATGGQELGPVIPVSRNWAASYVMFEWDQVHTDPSRCACIPDVISVADPSVIAQTALRVVYAVRSGQPDEAAGRGWSEALPRFGDLEHHPGAGCCCHCCCRCRLLRLLLPLPLLLSDPDAFIQVIAMQTPNGMVPNYANGGRKTRDRTEVLDYLRIRGVNS